MGRYHYHSTLVTIAEYEKAQKTKMTQEARDVIVATVSIIIIHQASYTRRHYRHLPSLSPPCLLLNGIDVIKRKGNPEIDGHWRWNEVECDHPTMGSGYWLETRCEIRKHVFLFPELLSEWARESVQLNAKTKLANVGCERTSEKPRFFFASIYFWP